jgi:hypothetical protein
VKNVEYGQGKARVLVVERNINNYDYDKMGVGKKCKQIGTVSNPALRHSHHFTLLHDVLLHCLKQST